MIRVDIGLFRGLETAFESAIALVTLTLLFFFFRFFVFLGAPFLEFGGLRCFS